MSWWGFFEDGFFHFWDDAFAMWGRCTEDSEILKSSEKVQFEDMPDDMQEDLQLKDFDVDSYVWYRVRR